jgi:hypothetical protein
VTSEVTHRDLADIRERLARIEEQTKSIPALVERVSVVERWKLKLMTVVSVVTAVTTYFATEIKRVLFT